jgi:hypothetical protein
VANTKEINWGTHHRRKQRKLELHLRHQVRLKKIRVKVTHPVGSNAKLRLGRKSQKKESVKQK